LPYAKRPKSSSDLDTLTESDKGFHWCNKPHFSEDGTLVYANSSHKSLEGGVFLTTQKPIMTAHKDVRFTKLPTFPDASPPTLDTQKGFTRVTSQSEVPTATVNPEFDFADFSKAVVIDGPAGSHEQKVWELLAILFDEYDDLPEGMDEEEFSQHRERFRKDKLSEYWESLVHSDAEKHAQQAKTAEEKAIAHLSCHNVPEACHTLLNGLDLRLATLVALIGGDIYMRQDMVQQIEEWRRMDVLAEMEDPIRAIYELLAGNCGKCEGKTEGGKENKTSTFTIAKRFGLDWRRAFALRLWYGTLDDEPIEMAVAQFADALRDGFDEVKPVPWFVEQNVDMGFKDPEADNREDILWGILKLYASSKLDLPANVEDILAPQNVSGHPLNARLSFQLFHLFKVRKDEPEPARQIGLPTNRSGDGTNESFLSSTASSTVKYEQAEDSLMALGDSLTLTYAGSLHTPKYWTTAAFVYAHLSSVELREQYIRSLLSYFSNTYELNDGDPYFDYLTKKLGVPRAWLHSAGALRAKMEGDDLRQTLHLLEAGELVEAHEVLCRSVGPSSVISRDYDALREVLGGFIPTPENSPVDDVSRARGRPRARKEPVPGWNHGGQIYFDYVHLVDLTSHRPSFSTDEDLNEEISTLLKKLQSSLETIARERWESRGLEERVALAEISGFVAELVRQRKGADRGRILKLPLTEDRWLHHTREISLSYYHTLMGVVN
jgi:nuclear pore complex protein Nup98-Nup96